MPVFKLKDANGDVVSRIIAADQATADAVALDLTAEPDDFEQDSDYVYSLLVKSRMEAVSYINQKIGEIRSQYMTTTPGQERIYMKKESEARAYVADPAPNMTDYPMIQAEIGITAPTALEVAQEILAKDSEWVQMASALENVRLNAISGARTAADQSILEVNMNNFHITLRALGF